MNDRDKIYTLRPVSLTRLLRLSFSSPFILSFLLFQVLVSWTHTFWYWSLKRHSVRAVAIGTLLFLLFVGFSIRHWLSSLVYWLLITGVRYHIWDIITVDSDVFEDQVRISVLTCRASVWSTGLRWCHLWWRRQWSELWAWPGRLTSSLPSAWRPWGAPPTPSTAVTHTHT